ncbi:MAG: DUF5050 domain-containing protein [Peptococcaceae bacterium]|nr:DUF5050 domain-containing protein [Peptococcaceae bacterium]
MKKSLKVVVLTLLILFMFSQAIYSLPNNNRTAGQNRYETAVEIARSGWNQSDFAIIAYGGNFPDALAATPLAKKYNAPILLTEKDSLSDITQQELIRLKTKKVYIVGGLSAVSSSVERQLKNINIEVIRLSGKDRFSTSVKIAELLDFSNQVIITTGEDFADSLSIAPIAANMNIPILLVPKSFVPDETKQFITQYSIDKAVIVGDSNVIENNINQYFKNTTRIYGNDKYERNISILNKYKSAFSTNMVYVASGNIFADALAGSALAAKKQAPIILLDNTIADVTRNYLSAVSVETVNILGGERALSSNLVSEYFTIPQNSTPTILYSMGSTNARINSGGFYTVNDDQIYISYPIEYTLSDLTKIEQSGIIKNYDGLNKQITNQVSGQNLNYMGDWLYFTTNGLFDNERNLISKIKIDGTGLTAIGQEKSSQIVVINDWIYYLNESDYNKMYKISIDGWSSSKTKLTLETASSFNITGEWIYYIADATIYKIKVDGTGNTIIYKPTKTGLNYLTNLVEYHNQLYFSLRDREESTGKSLYRCNLDGSELIKLIDKQLNDKEKFYIENDYIYFCYGQEIYRTTINGLEKITLGQFTSEENAKFYIVNGWLYYSSKTDYPVKVKL